MLCNHYGELLAGYVRKVAVDSNSTEYKLCLLNDFSALRLRRSQSKFIGVILVVAR